MFPKRGDAEKLAGRIPPIIISTQELRELKIVKDTGESLVVQQSPFLRLHI